MASPATKTRAGMGPRDQARRLPSAGGPGTPTPCANNAAELVGGIMAQGDDGHLTGALDRPLVVLLEQDGADEPDDGVLVGEDADHLGSALDLAVGAASAAG